MTATLGALPLLARAVFASAVLSGTFVLTAVGSADVLAHTPAGGAGTHSSSMSREQYAWGISGSADQVTQTVAVSMTDDMRFTPATISVKLNQTVKFVVSNDGKIMHEFVIGTKGELLKHAAMMEKFPNMVHDEPYMAHVDPGKSGEIIWTFNRLGEFEFACLLPGHYQAGMKGTIVVQK